MILVEQADREEVLYINMPNAEAVIKKLAKGLNLTERELESNFSTFGCVEKSFVVLSTCQISLWNSGNAT